MFVYIFTNFFQLNNFPVVHKSEKRTKAKYPSIWALVSSTTYQSPSLHTAFLRVRNPWIYIYSYLTIRLWARYFYEVIVDEGLALANYRLIEIEKHTLQRTFFVFSGIALSLKHSISSSETSLKTERRKLFSLLAIYRRIDSE